MQWQRFYKYEREADGKEEQKIYKYRKDNPYQMKGCGEKDVKQKRKE